MRIVYYIIHVTYLATTVDIQIIIQYIFSDMQNAPKQLNHKTKIFKSGSNRLQWLVIRLFTLYVSINLYTRASPRYK